MLIYPISDSWIARPCCKLLQTKLLLWIKGGKSGSPPWSCTNRIFLHKRAQKHAVRILDDDDSGGWPKTAGYVQLTWQGFQHEFVNQVQRQTKKFMYIPGNFVCRMRGVESRTKYIFFYAKLGSMTPPICSSHFASPQEGPNQAPMGMWIYSVDEVLFACIWL